MLRLLSRVVFNGKNLRPFSVQPYSNDIVDDVDRKRKILELEMDLMRQEGKSVPSKLRDSEWESLLELPSISARKRYYTFLFKCEMTKINLKKKKEERAVLREERLATNRELAANQHIVYGLGHNSFFLKIYDTTMNLWHNNKLVQAMQFSPKIVIDCSYDQYMNPMESDNCAKQLTLTFALNRLQDEPFDIHFCNFNVNSKCGSKLNRTIPTMFNPDFPINVTADSYLDIFDKNKLVYLTPHCRDELQNYNPDDVYIVGAMVDKTTSEPLSLAKAKKHGLRMAKFPLDRYYQFQGGKCLTINQVLEIMLQMKKYNNWKQALSSAIPRRKIGAHLTEQDYAEKFAPRRPVMFNKRSGENRERGHFDKFTKNIKIYNRKGE